MNRIWKSRPVLACLAAGSIALAGTALAQGQQGGPPRPAPDEAPEPPPPGAFVNTVLTGAAVAGGQGDANAMGSFNARIEADDGKMCYWLNAQHIAVPTSATINRGAARAAGQAVVTLRPPLGAIVTECIQIPEELAHQIADNPGQFYVTIGDLERPTGAIRGQLESAASS
jgi:hypothetical protein